MREKIKNPLIFTFSFLFYNDKKLSFGKKIEPLSLLDKNPYAFSDYLNNPKPSYTLYLKKEKVSRFRSKRSLSLKYPYGCRSCNFPSKEHCYPSGRKTLKPTPLK